MRYWHDQVTSLSIRLYDEGCTYENKDPFSGVIQVEILSDGNAYLHSALKSDGKNIGVSEWRDLISLLFNKYKIKYLTMNRKNQDVVIDIESILTK